jgi:5-oxoprolinase (ATP-hydrolysing) subunit A
MRLIDLNADIGEGGGDDAAILECVSSASIACGGHAGDEASMVAALRLCGELGVAPGAHPSYPDRDHFGRRALNLPVAQVFELVRGQISRLQTLAAQRGQRLAHVKPHGALYNQAAQDAQLADAVAAAVHAFDPSLALMGLAGSELPAAARRLGLRALEEVFADRAYCLDGSLAPRGEAGAVIDDPNVAVDQALSWALKGGVRTREGAWLERHADSICLHGDGAAALALARSLRSALDAAGVRVSAA